MIQRRCSDCVHFYPIEAIEDGTLVAGACRVLPPTSDAHLTNPIIVEPDYFCGSYRVEGVLSPDEASRVKAVLGGWLQIGKYGDRSKLSIESKQIIAELTRN